MPLVFILALVNEPSWLADGSPPGGDLGLRVVFILWLRCLLYEGFKITVFVCINPQRGEGAWPRLLVGGVDGPAEDVVPIPPTYLLSAGTLSCGTAPSEMGGKCGLYASKEEGVCSAIF